MSDWIISYSGQTFGPLSTDAVRDHIATSPLPRTTTAARVGGGPARPIYAWPEFADMAPPPVAQPLPMHPAQQRDVGTFALTRNCLGCVVALVAIPVLLWMLAAIFGGLLR